MDNFTEKSFDRDTDAQARRQRYANDNAQIKGWGIDANPKNDPTYPMRDRNNEDTKNYDWQRPPLQAETVEVLHSIERPNLTAAFGTEAPPSGLSGKIRRFAFKFSEGKMIHWLALILADRINVLEGLAEDITEGKMPQLLNERGIRAEWKHKPEAVVTKALISVMLISGAVLLYKSSSKK